MGNKLDVKEVDVNEFTINATDYVVTLPMLIQKVIRKVSSLWTKNAKANTTSDSKADAKADKTKELNRTVYGVYAEETDMTFIIEEWTRGKNTSENPFGLEYVSTEVKGFYYGRPNKEDNKTFYGKLEARY